MTGKLSNKEIVSRADMYTIDKSIMVAKLGMYLPLLDIKALGTVKHDSDFGWVNVAIVGSNNLTTILIHPKKQIVKYDDVDYRISGLNRLAVKIYSDLGMEMEALLYSIT